MTPQQPPQHIQIELARRELKALKQQQAIAEQGIEVLTNGAAQLGLVERSSTPNDINAILAALVALVSIRLLELRTSHENLMQRIPELEGALKTLDSNIVVPGMRVKN